MKPPTADRGRVLELHAAAKRLQVPERTLRYRASRGRVPGAFKQGKLWKFRMPAALALVCLLFLPVHAAGGFDPARYRGKVVLLNFWATWCHGCKEEIPWFVEFEKQYKADGLAVVGVSMDEDGWKSVKPWLKEHKLNYPVQLGSEPLARQYGATANLPVTVLFDRNGKQVASYSGVVDRAACEQRIRELLGAVRR